MPISPPSGRATVKRFRARGRYDRDVIDAILDSSLVCHVGFNFDDHPVVIPTLYWREGDRLYWHGSVRSRMMQACQGAQVCITVTRLDGLVLARSAFNHSANYRSVTLFGEAASVIDPKQKLIRMRSMVESIFPGRWDHLRPITPKELAATQILWIPIVEASAKLRSGPANDIEDADWPVWAGVIPISTNADHPVKESTGNESFEGSLLRLG